MTVSVFEDPLRGRAGEGGDLIWSTVGQFATSCSSNSICLSERGAGEITTAIATIFTTQKNGNVDPAQESFIIKDRQISATSNGESAIVELPDVTGFGTNTSPPQLIVTYYVDNADTYDWSTPPLVSTRYYVRFLEQLSTTFSAQASEIIGIDHQAQAQDERNTFIAGILLGVAGGAAIAVVQEGLHMVFDDRDDSRRPKPSRRQPNASS